MEEVLLLTPVQKWQAAQKLETNPVMGQWLSTMLVVVLIVLGVSFVGVSLYRTVLRLRAAERLFDEYVRRKGLTQAEAEMALAISIKAGAKFSPAIFTDGGMFDRGAAGVIEAGIRAGDSDDRSKKLRAELARLREKLGFRSRPVWSIGQMSRTNGMSSRQIPRGKEMELFGTAAGESGMAAAKCTVIDSNDIELTVRLEQAIQFEVGQHCTVRYELAASYWEFDSAVISCGEGNVVLSHSDDVRLINRRLFKRVSLNRHAYIALFPFVRGAVGSTAAENESENAQLRRSRVEQARPDFVPAGVVELAGTRVVAETRLDVKVGDRVLILFELDDKVAGSADGEPARIIEDIGFVRYVRVAKEGLAATVEMTGLSDSDLSELVRLTGSVPLEAVARTQGAEQMEKTSEESITAKEVS